MAWPPRRAYEVTARKLPTNQRKRYTEPVLTTLFSDKEFLLIQMPLLVRHGKVSENLGVCRVARIAQNEILITDPSIVYIQISFDV